MMPNGGRGSELFDLDCSLACIKRHLPKTAPSHPEVYQLEDPKHNRCGDACSGALDSIFVPCLGKLDHGS